MIRIIKEDVTSPMESVVSGPMILMTSLIGLSQEAPPLQLVLAQVQTIQQEQTLVR